MLLQSLAFSVAMMVQPYALPAGAQKPVTCNIPSPCALFTNNGSGSAVEGSGSSGIAILGISASGSYADAAIDGESSNQTGNDAGGTFGLGNATGANPYYGALGYGTGFGLYGETEASPTSGGAGVYGYDAGGAGGSSDLNAGVLGQSGPGTGVLGEAGSASYQPFDAAGVAGIGAARSGSIFPVYGVYAQSDTTPLVTLNSQTGSYVELDPAGFVIEGAPAGSTYQSFYVTTAGHEYLAGTLTTSKGTYVRQRGTSGVTRLTYGARTTVPQIEDVGEGRVTSGRADVTFDAALSDSIDSSRGYIVFVTPEGDCKGLYVTNKTATGFTVRELQGGRSSLSFAYRIVAKPLGAAETRLAVAPPLPAPHALPRSSGTASSTASFVTPESRLRARLGPAGFAAVFAARRNNLRSLH